MLGLHINIYQTQIVAFTGAMFPEGMILGVQMMNIDTTCSGRAYDDSRLSLPYLMVV